MKNFLQHLMIFFESIGKARAAAMFTRAGDYESARRIMKD